MAAVMESEGPNVLSGSDDPLVSVATLTIGSRGANTFSEVTFDTSWFTLFCRYYHMSELSLAPQFDHTHYCVG